jgi:DNA-binding response OmpR family regulator
VSSKILVVDDVAMNVKLLADLLAVKGYQTCTASSGPEALAVLEQETPDLVLLDVMMPGMSGYEVCQAIRANPAHAMLPVVLVTALDPALERAKGLDAGADDFLNKPVSQAELLARVRSLLRIKSLYDEVLRQKGELSELNRTPSAVRRRSATGEGGPPEALLLASARRSDRRGRRRGSAEKPSARDHRRLPRPARLHGIY